MRFSKLRFAAIAALTGSFISYPAWCDAPNYGKIDRELTPVEHAFIEGSIKRLGLSDPEILVSKTKKAKLQIGSTLWIARTEDPRLCFENNCLTFLIEGHRQDEWTIRAMLYAGDHLSMAEPTDEPFGLGVLVFSTSKPSPEKLVTATETPLGWLIR